MKYKKRNCREHIYTFEVKKKNKFFPLIVLINRDSNPYCLFSNGVFTYPNGEKKDDMINEEKIQLWKHINFYGNNVTEHSTILIL